jgi:hypothetical protein
MPWDCVLACVFRHGMSKLPTPAPAARYTSIDTAFHSITDRDIFSVEDFFPGTIYGVGVCLAGAWKVQTLRKACAPHLN